MEDLGIANLDLAKMELQHFPVEHTRIVWDKFKICVIKVAHTTHTQGHI